MGFCLFEDARWNGFYFAVNPQEVLEITPEADWPFAACGIEMSVRGPEEPLIVAGEKDDIHAVLMQGLKIGVKKAEIKVLGGMNATKPTSLLLNAPDRIALMREMLPEEFADQNVVSPTASELFFADGSIRRVAQRPGVLAYHMNAGGQVPVLSRAQPEG